MLQQHMCLASPKVRFQIPMQFKNEQMSLSLRLWSHNMDQSEVCGLLQFRFIATNNSNGVG